MKIASFLHNIIHWTADRGPFDQGDRAKCAGPAAAIGDFDICAASLASCAYNTLLIRADGWSVRQVVERVKVTIFIALASIQLGDQIDDIHPAAGSQDAINSGHLLSDHLSIALGEAAGGNEHLAPPLLSSQLCQHIQGFLPSRVDETAGINDQHTSLSCPVGRDVTGRLQ